MTTLYIVVPCYNEEEVLTETSRRLRSKLHDLISEGKIDSKSRICFVDDGSKDSTWEIICEHQGLYPEICGIKLAHNRGHQNALLCGLMTVKPFCDCAVSIDADLQDDINVIDSFLVNYEDGCDIVYGVRDKRDTDTFFKKATAEGFYKFLNLLGVECVYNHADYRLMSRRALDALSQYDEVNLFLRGMVPTIGYKTAKVFYDRSERLAGESKYPLKKMLALAWEGVTSFSVVPLRLICSIGVLICIISFIASIVLLFVSALSALVASLWFLGGLQMIAVGICGQYIGKIYSEVKHRPKYIVEEFLHD